MIKLATFASVSIMITKNGFAAVVVAGYMRTATLNDELSALELCAWCVL